MITITEIVESREVSIGDPARATLRYFAEGTDDEIELIAELTDKLPEDWAGWPRKAFSQKPLGNGCWNVEAVYEFLELDEDSDADFSFDTTATSAHITQSKQTVNKYAPAGKVAQNHGGAIGWNGNNNEGCDILIPTFQFSETHVRTGVTNDYKKIVRSLTAKTNSAQFRTFAIGEVLFLGASGRRRGDGKYVITYKFAANENKTGLTVGDPAIADHYIEGIDKAAWDHIWISYAEKVDAAATPKQRLKRPISAYVERVYDSADFSQLGIG